MNGQNIEWNKQIDIVDENEFPLRPVKTFFCLCCVRLWARNIAKINSNTHTIGQTKCIQRGPEHKDSEELMTLESVLRVAIVNAFNRSVRFLS